MWSNWVIRLEHGRPWRCSSNCAIEAPANPSSALASAITLVGSAPIVAVVRAESPLRTGADFVAKDRAKPGALTDGSAGNGTSSVAAFLNSGRMRALAATGAKRSSLQPDVATFEEAGMKGYQADVWDASFAPAGTPPAMLMQWHAAFKRAAESEDFRKRAVTEGLVVTMDSPEDTTRIVRAEEAKWRRVVKERSIQQK